MDQKPPQNASLAWQDDGAPRSTLFDDPYFSSEGGLDETRHVFLQGNGLPERFVDGFHIAELGFGTGLNLLATWQAWRNSGARGKLRFTSFEAFPLSLPDMKRACACWPELAELADLLLQNWPLQGPVNLGDVEVEVIIGDISATLPAWQNKADAWFLDGFSPSKNPDMWSEITMLEVGKHTASNGTFATYTSAGHVRRSLAEAGFGVERVQGFGRKRHMSVGKMLG